MIICNCAALTLNESFSNFFKRILNQKKDLKFFINPFQTLNNATGFNLLKPEFYI